MKKYDNVVLFLHHQRSGGTSIRNFFNKQILPVPYLQIYRDEGEVKKRILSPQHSNKIIEIEPGIIPEGWEEIFNVFTVFRNPIDRAFSFIERYTRIGQPNVFKVSEELLKNRLSEQFWNHIINKIKNNPSSYISYNLENCFAKSYIYGFKTKSITTKEINIFKKRISNVYVIPYKQKDIEQEVLAFLKNSGFLKILDNKNHTQRIAAETGMYNDFIPPKEALELLSDLNSIDIKYHTMYSTNKV